MKREEAFKLVNEWTENPNLVKHMLAVEAQMIAICKYLKAKDPVSAEGYDEVQYGLVGLIHDADYNKFPDKHPQVIIDELKKRGEKEEIVNAIEAHAWKYNGFDREPKTKLEWAIYTCDELSGLIIACALVRPEKKLSSVTLDAVKKKWKEKSFAKGVIRENIALCEEKLGIKLDDYIALCLKALQGISKELGL